MRLIRAANTVCNQYRGPPPATALDLEGSKEIISAAVVIDFWGPEIFFGPKCGLGPKRGIRDKGRPIGASLG